MQMILLIKALSYSVGVSQEWYVSMSLDPWSDFPPGRGRAVMLALTVEIQPVQWKRGWQLEKIHSQSKRSVETGMPTFQSSDRSTLGSMPGHSWLNARSGCAHTKAYLSSSQLWSMGPPWQLIYSTVWHNHTTLTSRCRWQMMIVCSVERWEKLMKWWTLDLNVGQESLELNVVLWCSLVNFSAFNCCPITARNFTFI